MNPYSISRKVVFDGVANINDAVKNIHDVVKNILDAIANNFSADVIE